MKSKILYSTPAWCHYPVDIGADRSGSISVVSKSGIPGPRNYALFTTVTYRETLVSVGTDDSDVPFSYNLAQNYPSPFTPFSTIESSLPEAGPVRLVVFDVWGGN